MRIRLRTVLAGAGTAAMVLGGVVGLTGMASAAPANGGAAALSATPAQAHSQRIMLSAKLAASVPGDPEIFGVAPGGIPWVIKDGNVRLGSAGALQVNVTGLVDPTTGQNPVPYLAASVYCNGVKEAETAPVPFSAMGNAHLHATVSLPAFCPAPTVLLNPAKGSAATDVLGVYIAFDGTAPPVS